MVTHTTSCAKCTNDNVPVPFSLFFCAMNRRYIPIRTSLSIGIFTCHKGIRIRMRVLRAPKCMDLAFERIA